MPEGNLSKDEQALARLYQETIDLHRAYLERLHEAFNNRCEEIGEGAKKKLGELDEEDEEGRKQILMGEQELLDKTLAELKYAINRSNAEAREKLEEIQRKIEEKAMDLDAKLANL